MIATGRRHPERGAPGSPDAGAGRTEGRSAAIGKHRDTRLCRRRFLVLLAGAVAGAAAVGAVAAPGVDGSRAVRAVRIPSRPFEIADIYSEHDLAG